MYCFTLVPTTTLTLVLDKSEGNAEGIFAYVANNVEIEGVFVDGIVILMPLTDIDDIELITATLLKDGSGFQITKPSVSKFVITKESLPQIYKVEDPKAAMSIAMRRSHLVAANAVKTTPSLQTKKITFMFPDGIKCRKGPFNETDDEFKLHNNIGVVEGSLHGPIQFYNSAVYWKVELQNEKRVTKVVKKVDPIQEITKAVQRMHTS